MNKKSSFNALIVVVIFIFALVLLQSNGLLPFSVIGVENASQPQGQLLNNIFVAPEIDFTKTLSNYGGSEPLSLYYPNIFVFEPVVKEIQAGEVLSQNWSTRVNVINHIDSIATSKNYFPNGTRDLSIGDTCYKIDYYYKINSVKLDDSDSRIIDNSNEYAFFNPNCSFKIASNVYAAKDISQCTSPLAGDLLNVSGKIPSDLNGINNIELWAFVEKGGIDWQKTCINTSFFSDVKVLDWDLNVVVGEVEPIIVPSCLDSEIWNGAECVVIDEPVIDVNNFNFILGGVLLLLIVVGGVLFFKSKK